MDPKKSLFRILSQFDGSLTRRLKATEKETKRFKKLEEITDKLRRGVGV